MEVKWKDGFESLYKGADPNKVYGEIAAIGETATPEQMLLAILKAMAKNADQPEPDDLELAFRSGEYSEEFLLPDLAHDQKRRGARYARQYPADFPDCR